jgi:AcrR family transcriptional regulator
MAPVTHERAKRVDAVRNRERVIAAAQAVFAEAGLEASIEEVADRAGVGRATIYRSFPTKEHLIAGVAIERLATFERLATDALADEDAGAAFRRVLVTIAELQAGNRILLSALRVPGDVTGLDEARTAMTGALERLMRRAKRQGSLRRDATPADVKALMSGLTHSLTAEQQSDPKVWRRYANLIADALAA